MKYWLNLYGTSCNLISYLVSLTVVVFLLVNVLIDLSMAGTFICPAGSGSCQQLDQLMLCNLNSSYRLPPCQIDGRSFQCCSDCVANRCTLPVTAQYNEYPAVELLALVTLLIVLILAAFGCIIAAYVTFLRRPGRRVHYQPLQEHIDREEPTTEQE